MQRTRPTSSMSQIHSVVAPVRSASWLRSGISVSSSDSTSLAVSTGSPSSDLQLAVDAHRRPRVRREIQRRRAARGRDPQQPLEAGQRRVAERRRRLGANRVARHRQHDGRLRRGGRGGVSARRRRRSARLRRPQTLASTGGGATGSSRRRRRRVVGGGTAHDRRSGWLERRRRGGAHGRRRRLRRRGGVDGTRALAVRRAAGAYDIRTAPAARRCRRRLHWRHAAAIGVVNGGGSGAPQPAAAVPPATGSLAGVGRAATGGGASTARWRHHDRSAPATRLRRRRFWRVDCARSSLSGAAFPLARRLPRSRRSTAPAIRQHGAAASGAHLRLRFQLGFRRHHRLGLRLNVSSTGVNGTSYLAASRSRHRSVFGGTGGRRDRRRDQGVRQVGRRGPAGDRPRSRPWRRRRFGACDD